MKTFINYAQKQNKSILKKKNPANLNDVNHILPINLARNMGDSERDQGAQPIRIITGIYRFLKILVLIPFERQLDNSGSIAREVR